MDSGGRAGLRGLITRGNLSREREVLSLALKVCRGAARSRPTSEAGGKVSSRPGLGMT